MKRGSVVVLTNERDFAADDVVRRLAEVVPVRRLNIESARRSAITPWSPASTASGHDGNEPLVVWWRQFEIDDRPSSLDDIDDVLVNRAQWRSWLSTLANSDAAWINDLWAARRAENKIEQLRTAASVDLVVPRTVVTNDPDTAARFRDQVGGDAVVKTLAAGYFAFSDQSFVFTELLTDDVLARRDLWYDAPLIVQQSLVTALDARVISFGDECFGARCASKGTDWRKTPFEAELWSRWDPPSALVKACRTYRRAMGLEYAAFDFMLENDDAVFLEANQAGEWLFLDRHLELGVAEAFTKRVFQLLADQVATRP